MHELVIRGGTVVDGTGAPAVTADVAVDDGRITAVGQVDERGERELDADGLVVAPGWVDIHTHYDGQVTWDPEITPSSWHGVTTVVMGNCGVGFAPVRPGAESFLIELMEGVEDIPGTALHEGIAWDWESFPQYLDALDKTPRAIDIAAQVPHAALRAYVMGERAHEREAERRRDRRDVEAGRGRPARRRLRHQHQPHDPAQLAARPRARHRRAAGGAARPRRGHRPSRPRRVPARVRPPGRRRRPCLARRPGRAHRCHRHLRPRPGALRARTRGATRSPPAPRTAPPVAGSSRRSPAGPPGCSSASSRRCTRSSPTPPTATSPTCRWPSGWPGCRSRRCAPRCSPTSPAPRNPIALGLMQRWEQIFPLGDPPDYEPPRSASIAGVAEREGRSPQEVALDWLLERDGTAFLFAPLASYVDHDHEALREMMTDPNTVLGLSDGGAHCGLICDVSMPTYLLTHWVNGRQRGPRLGLEQAISLQTSRTAVRLRLHRPRRDRRGQARRPQPHRPRRHAPARARRWCSTSPPAVAASSSAPTATSPPSSPARSPSSTASRPAPAPAASSASRP